MVVAAASLLTTGGLKMVEKIVTEGTVAVAVLVIYVTDTVVVVL